MSDTATLERPEAPARRKGKSQFELDPVRAAEAAKALVESIRAIAGSDDVELISDMVEGETDLFEIIDRLVQRIGANAAYVRGIDAQVEDLKARQARFEKRIAVDRALIEQAMMIADLPKIERAGATLSLSARAPKVVIDTEADIPAKFFVTGDPTLDKKAVGEALKARKAAIDALPDDPEQRAAALAELPPDIPGAHLDNAAPSLTLRVK